MQAEPRPARLPSDARRVLRGSVWVLSGRLVFGVSALLQNVVLARLLGPQDLGLFLLVQSVVLPAALFAVFGLDLLAMRELRDPSKGENEVSPTSFLRRGAVVIAMAAALAALALLGVTATFCGLVAREECSLAPQVAPLLWPLIGLSALQLLLAGLLRALGRIGAATYLAGVLSTALVLCAAAVALGVRVELDFRGVLWLQVVALAIAAVAAIVYLCRIPDIGRGGAASFGHILRSGPLLLTTQLLALLVTQSDVWIFGMVATPEDIARYGLAARLAQLVSLPHLVLGGVLPPMMAVAIREQRQPQLQRVVRASVAAATLPSAALAAWFALLGGTTLALVFGGYYAAAAPSLAILALGNVVNVACGPCSQMLIMAGHQRALNLITLGSCLFCLGLGALAAAYLGAVGVACVYALGLSLQGVAGASASRRLTGVKTHAGFGDLAGTVRDLLQAGRHAR